MSSKKFNGYGKMMSPRTGGRGKHVPGTLFLQTHLFSDVPVQPHFAEHPDMESHHAMEVRVF